MRFFRRVLTVTLFALIGSTPLAAQERSDALPPPPPPPLIAPDERDLPSLSVQPRDQGAQPDREQSAQDGFVPLSQLPPEEQLPAAPMLVGAYIAVVLALFLYLLSLSRRLASVKQEIARLDAEVTRSHRP